MKDRISAIIKEKGLSKTAFAKSLNLSQPFVSQLCSGASLPSERTIRDICDTYSVNEYWLRTGEGEMFRQKSRQEEFAEYMGKLVGGELDPFHVALVSALAKLDETQIALLADIAVKIADEYKKEKADQ